MRLDIPDNQLWLDHCTGEGILKLITAWRLSEFPRSRSTRTGKFMEKLSYCNRIHKIWISVITSNSVVTCTVMMVLHLRLYAPLQTWNRLRVCTVWPFDVRYGGSSQISTNVVYPKDYITKYIGIGYNHNGMTKSWNT